MGTETIDTSKPRGLGRPPKYPYHLDTFDVRAKTRKHALHISRAVHRYAKRHGKAMTCNVMREGGILLVRVWRVAV